MDGWMIIDGLVDHDGLMDGWMDGWMGWWMDGWMDHRWMESRQTDRQMNEIFG